MMMELFNFKNNNEFDAFVKKSIFLHKGEDGTIRFESPFLNKIYDNYEECYEKISKKILFYYEFQKYFEDLIELSEATDYFVRHTEGISDNGHLINWDKTDLFLINKNIDTKFLRKNQKNA
jgi:hypothetical protein